MFCPSELPLQHLAMSGYYQEDLLPKATSTMRRLRLLSLAALEDMDRLCRYYTVVCHSKPLEGCNIPTARRLVACAEYYCVHILL